MTDYNPIAKADLKVGGIYNGNVEGEDIQIFPEIPEGSDYPRYKGSWGELYASIGDTILWLGGGYRLLDLSITEHPDASEPTPPAIKCRLLFRARR